MVGTTVQSLKLEVAEVETARTKEQERADHAQQLLTNARNQLIQVLLFVTNTAPYSIQSLYLHTKQARLYCNNIIY